MFVEKKVSLSGQIFVATKIRCHDKRFVATKDVFRSDKHVFVATKIILVAAPANDISVASPFRFVAFLTFLNAVISLHKKNMFVGLKFPFCLTDECHRTISMSSTWNNNNNNVSYIVLYPIKIYELVALYIININMTIKKAEVL